MGVIHPSIRFTIPCGLPEAEISLTLWPSTISGPWGNGLRISGNVPPSLPQILSKPQRDHNSLLDSSSWTIPSSIFSEYFWWLSTPVCIITTFGQSSHLWAYQKRIVTVIKISRPRERRFDSKWRRFLLYRTWAGQSTCPAVYRNFNQVRVIGWNQARYTYLLVEIFVRQWFRHLGIGGSEIGGPFVWGYRWLWEKLLRDVDIWWRACMYDWLVMEASYLRMLKYMRDDDDDLMGMMISIKLSVVSWAGMRL